MTGFNALQISFPRKEKPGGIGRRIRSNNGALSCILVGNVAAVIQGSVRVECQAVCQALPMKGEIALTPAVLSA